MQYSHLPIPERRDSNLDSNANTPFQTPQSIGQALVGSHLNHQYHRTDYRNLSTSPPSHQQPPPSHSPLAFTVPPSASPAIKRKPVDNPIPQQVLKRRRDTDDADPYDLDPAGQGAKHWTDEEKSKLFSWLMGSGQDEHWNALRATKNSCLRECAQEVFDGKKTYQALKGCYERNFNLFKQIYAFEQHHSPNNDLSQFSEADRLREYERRLATARKAGCDVGNITARTIEHWHRRGWYSLFYRRWHGDPATTRPSQSRNSSSANNNGPVDDVEQDDDHTSHNPPPPPQTHHHHHQQQQQQQQQQSHQPTQPQQPSQSQQHQPQQSTTTSGLDFTTDPAITNGMNGFTPHINYINPQTLRDPLVPPSPATVPTGPSTTSHLTIAGGPSTSGSAVNGVPSSSSTSSSHPHISNVVHHTSSHAAAANSTTVPPSATSNSSSSALNPSIPSANPGDSPVVNFSVTQTMLSTFLQFLQVQTQTGKMKLEYLRRREEREEKESSQRRELERLKLEREAAEYERSKHSEDTKQKTAKAIELISNPQIDESVKRAASDFLKKQFAID